MRAYRLTFLSIAFLIGLALARAALSTGWGARFPAWGWGLAALACGILAWFESRQRRFQPLPLPVCAALAAVFLGLARYAGANGPLTPADLAWHNDRGPLTLQGWVAEPPVFADDALEVFVTIEPDGAAGSPRRGRAWLRLAPGENWQYGDRLTFTGAPRTPRWQGAPYDSAFYFPAEAARLPGRRGNFVSGAVFALRLAAARELERQFPMPESAVAQGVLLGIESSLPESLIQAFRKTGTSHLLVVSGFNVAVLAGLAAGLFNRALPRWPAAGATAAVILLYTALTGGQPPVLRAATMAGLALLAQQIGRRGMGVNTLAFSAAALSLAKPTLPWDVSFQLSFSATLGMALYAGPLQAWWTAVTERLPRAILRPAARAVGEAALITLAAQVVTLPVTLAHFGQVSLTALLANPLVQPAQPGLMMLTGISTLAGLVFHPLGMLLALPAWPLAAWTVFVAETLARIPGSVASLQEGAVWAALALAVAPLVLQIPRLRAGLKPGLALLGGALLAFTVWSAAQAAPDGRLRVTLYALDEQAVALARSPTGQTLLVGGASAANSLENALGQSLPFFTRQLDLLILPQASAAALQGLPGALENYPPGQILWAVPFPALRVADRVSALSARVSRLAPGQAARLDSGAELRVLAAGERAAALELRWRNFRLLIPGGLGAFSEAAGAYVFLTPADLRAAPPEVWEALQPQQVILLGNWPDAPAGWLRLPPGQHLELQSDGAQAWLAQ